MEYVCNSEGKSQQLSAVYTIGVLHAWRELEDIPEMRTFFRERSLRACLVWDLNFSSLPQIIQIHSKNYTIPLGLRHWNNEAERKCSTVRSQNRTWTSHELKSFRASRGPKMYPMYVSTVQSLSCYGNRSLAWKTIFTDGTDIGAETTLALSCHHHLAMGHLAFICPGHCCRNPGLVRFQLRLFLYLPSWLLAPLLINASFTLPLAVSIFKKKSIW